MGMMDPIPEEWPNPETDPALEGTNPDEGQTEPNPGFPE
jgi:hypothetical protein